MAKYNKAEKAATSFLSFEEYCENIGKLVIKHSKKPFKSQKKVNTVKTVIYHPVTNLPAYTFWEDNSFVEARQCKTI